MAAFAGTYEKKAIPENSVWAIYSVGKNITELSQQISGVAETMMIIIEIDAPFPVES